MFFCYYPVYFLYWIIFSVVFILNKILSSLKRRVIVFMENVFINPKLKKKLFSSKEIIKYEVNPNFEIYIDAINLKDGKIEKKKITEYSIHKNIKMYNIKDKMNRFKSFNASEDHSLIIYDSDKKKYDKISPKKLLKYYDKKLFFIQKHDENIFYIPLKDIEITFNENETIGYDFTVEDFYTFCTFDGIFVQDTMTVYTVHSDQSIKEVKEKMLVRLDGNESMTTLTYGLSKECYLGLYLLTKPLSNNKEKHMSDEFVKTLFSKILEFFVLEDNDKIYKLWMNDIINNNYYDVYDTIIYKNITTTYGIFLYNICWMVTKGDNVNILFDNFDSYYPNYIKTINKKEFKTHLQTNYKNHGFLTTYKALDIFKMLSFVTSTYMGVSMPIDEFELPDFIKEKKEELDKINDPEEYTEKYKEIADELHIYMKKHNMQISDLVESGSGKGWDQPDQLLLAKGAVANPQGDVYLSKNSLSKGFNSVEFFYGGGASRKGIIDRVLNTASTGYLTRQLVYALGSVMLSENIDDCNTNEYLTFYLNKEIAERITGRWIKTENMNSWMQINSIKELDDLIGKKIYMRSPIYCKSHKLCKKCFGKLGEVLKSNNVGILAGNTIGERGTQMIMRTFHTGGKVNVVIPQFLSIISDNSSIDIITISKYINISTENKRTLIALNDGILKIKKDVVDNEDNKQFNSNDFTKRDLMVDVFHGQLIIDDYILPIVLDYKGKVYSDKDIEFDKEKKEYTLYIKKNQKFYVMDVLMDDFLGKITKLQQFLRATRPINNPNHFLMVLFENYKDISDIDLVYLEILVSQLMRDKNDLSVPYRLGKSKEYVFKSIKDIPKLSSYRLGMQFENIEDALTNGIINKTKKQDSPLENVYSKNLTNSLDDTVDII
jgi:hypothetical protein